MNKKTLTDIERKENNILAKKKYYQKNKDKFRDWNNKTGFTRLINNCNDKDELEKLIIIIKNKLLIII
tara:strand:- start:1832 stop:2035 length:204 start_codon:yes stop_codon:yes gene_type:complete